MLGIYVEGIADIKFLKDLIEYFIFENQDLGKIDRNKKEFSSKEKNFFIKSLEGKGNLKNSIQNIKQKYDSGYEIVIVFDADGDFQKTKEQLERTLSNANILNFKIFLFPNNQSNGTLEDLLISIVKDRVVLKCWEAYENCLAKESKNYTRPSMKTKIYAYLEAIIETSQKENIKEHSRDYKNLAHWMLENNAIKPLEKFLRNLFLHSE
ncbi:MAG: hypothetical protein N3A69_16455 [Leptospiraceae bacterium]|nr:hypothetical protein [Leptospiraceae bacterium]